MTRSQLEALINERWRRGLADSWEYDPSLDVYILGDEVAFALSEGIVSVTDLSVGTTWFCRTDAEILAQIAAIYKSASSRNET